MSWLSTQEITKVYHLKKGDIYALKGISMEVPKGAVLGLLGVNGAGKTTLSSIIASLCPPSSGEVLFQGRSIYTQLKQYRKILGFCPQKPNLDPLLSLDQSLLFAGRFYGMRASEILAKKEQLIESFNLGEYRGAVASTLSGGYKQRFLIARSLIHSPKILILDEPTVGLDPHIRRELWKIINDLKKQGTTIILTTHYLEEAEALVDHVCMIDRGTVVTSGRLDDVKKSYNKESLEDIFLDIQQGDA